MCLINALFLRVLNRPATSEEVKLAEQAFEVIDGEHEEVLKSLADYKNLMAGEVEVQVKARDEGIVTAKKTLADYKVELVGIEAQRDKEQKEEVAKREQALLGAGDGFSREAGRLGSLTQRYHRLDDLAPEHADNVEWSHLASAGGWSRRRQWSE